ncbi:hypothetical protein E6R60_07290 [Streptomyces sp. A0642]|uniref:hypothetical protein n=1 Tax=Streptomyces sp. A0642 TaxID=2563100 RepID=UPI0010A29508|nr:hypothetical protein [Streptomyces sp. A0642]THA77373.1 hypothetical protein E6R60_07290 [Streptomyces sp. A0642]
MTTWRQLLTGLQDNSLNDVERETLVARAAVRLAADRGPKGRRPTIEEVVAIAREEFAVILDAGVAGSALHIWARTGG